MTERPDEAALANELFGRLSQMTDDDLAEMGLHRDDIPSVSANMARLFKVAHKANNARSWGRRLHSAEGAGKQGLPD